MLRDIESRFHSSSQVHRGVWVAAPFPAKSVHDKRGQQQAGQLCCGRQEYVLEVILCQDELPSRATAVLTALRMQLQGPGTIFTSYA